MKWTEQQSYIKKVYSDWEHFVAFGDTEGLTVRQEILESWQRCNNNGVSPMLWEAPSVLDEEELRVELQTNADILESASPFLNELAQHLDGTGQVLVLCNPKANILEIVGDRTAHRNASKVNLVPGAGIGESYHGTTAAALVILKQMPTTIIASEHFCTGPKEWSSAAAPLKLPNGDLKGIICIAGRYMKLTNHSTGFILSAARAIQERMLGKHLYRRGALSLAYMDTVLRHHAELIVSVDTSGEVADSSKPNHPLFIDHTAKLHLIPVIKQNIQNIMVNPSSSKLILDNIIVNDKTYIITYNSVYKDQELCGILMYAYGSGHGKSNLYNNISDPAKNNSKQKDNTSPQECHFGDLIGVSAAFNRTIELARRVAPSDATVVILGETGVGKEGLAQGIHKSSSRANRPFIAVNCGAIPKELIAGELLGYAPGAFTGASTRGNIGKIEAANGGTLFLDEVGELPIETQTYLLRVLQEKEVVRLGTHKPIPVDVRIIAATHRNLLQLIQEGGFREDLFFRLSVVEILVPPLRERPEDLPHLIAHFCSKNDLNGGKLKEETLRILASYKWPGNVRELMNIIQRAAALGENVETILLNYVMPRIESYHPNNDSEIVKECDNIVQTLQSTGGNVAQAARELGIARSTIYRHLKQKQNTTKSTPKKYS